VCRLDGLALLESHGASSKVLGEAAWASTMIPLCVLPCKLLVVLASSIHWDFFFVKSLNFSNYCSIRIRDERERLVTASPVMTKNLGLDGESNYPENGPVKPVPPRRDTRALSPTGIGAVPLSGAEAQTARAVSSYAQYAYLPHSLQMGSMN
jgi:hypothetical protein